MKASISVAAWAALAFTAHAGSISYSGTSVDLGGSGYGNVLNVLSVMNRGSEYGAVTWNGSADVLSGHATNTSKTRTAAAMQAAGITGTSFALYFNGNEPGNAPSVTLNDFTLHFLAADGSSLFNLLYTAPAGGQLITDFGGAGQAGWLFNVTLATSEAAQFFGNAANRIGMSIAANQAIGQTAGGAESFFLGAAPANPGGGGTPTPEPASVAVWGLCAVGALVTAKRRR